MSAFEQAREAEAYRRVKPPSALQIAWIVVLLTFGGIGAWLALSPPPEASSPTTSDVPLVAEAHPSETHSEALEATASTEEAAATQPAAETTAAATAEEPAPVAAAVAADRPAIKLAPVDSRLIESSTYGPLPKVDGAREPWQVYARPFGQTSARSRISIVIAGLGLSKFVTLTAISTLPGEVTLAFSPYGDDLQARVDEARAHGHEVLLQIPMEPEDYPKNDPGPQTLLTSLPASENLNRMHWAMGRFTGYVGLVNEMGSRYTASESHMTATLEDVKARGLLFMDARSSQYSAAARLARTMRVPRVLNNRYIDASQTEDNIRKRLEELENVARTYGAAAGIGYAYPITMRIVAEWAANLNERGFDLAPISAVANRQPVR